MCVLFSVNESWKDTAVLLTQTIPFSLVWPCESTSHWAARWHMSCSFIVCSLHCPQGLLLTRQGNTWSLLCFKWLTLRLHSPLGVRPLHFAPCFPTEPPRREASVRSVPHETLETRHSSLLNPGWRDRSTQGDHLSAPTSATGFTWKGHAGFRLVSPLL